MNFNLINVGTSIRSTVLIRCVKRLFIDNREAEGSYNGIIPIEF